MWWIVLAVAVGWLALAGLAALYVIAWQPPEGSRQRRVAVALASTAKPATIAAGGAAVAAFIASRGRRTRSRVDEQVADVSATRAAADAERAAVATRIEAIADDADAEMDDIEADERADIEAIEAEPRPDGHAAAERIKRTLERVRRRRKENGR